jgi:hypothetical protein
MREFLMNYRWKLNGTVDEDWIEFRNVTNYLVENFVPVLKMRNKQRPKWLTNEIVRLIRKKKRLWKTAKQYNTGEAREDYKKVEKEVAKKIRLAKRKFEKDMVFN